MKINTITIILLCLSISLYAQEHDHERSLQTDSTWGHEFFEFPIGFAQEIDYEGIEDATFPRGWSDQESDEFWSYAFSWDVQLDRAVNAKEVERDLQIYFDGLMKLNHENKDNTEVKKSTAKFFKEGSTDGIHRFKGKIRTLNAFHTQKAFTLNVTVEQHLCEEDGTSIIVFRFSPKEFGEHIWRSLNQITIREDFCGL